MDQVYTLTDTVLGIQMTYVCDPSVLVRSSQFSQPLLLHDPMGLLAGGGDTTAGKVDLQLVHVLHPDGVCVQDLDVEDSIRSGFVVGARKFINHYALASPFDH